MNKTGKIVSIIMWVLIVISAILVVSLMANINEDNRQDPTMQSWIDTNLWWAYILFVIAGALAIFFGIFQMITNKKAAKNGLVVVIFFAVVVGISYLMASDQIPQFLGVEKFIDNGTLTAKVAKMVDTGLYATYILLGIAILAITFSSASRLFKR